MLTRLGDLPVPDIGQAGNQKGIANTNLTIPDNFFLITNLSPTTKFQDTKNIFRQSRHMLFAVLVTTAIAQTAGQATVQVYAGFNSFGGGAGAASSLPANGDENDQSVIGATANFGPNAASIPKGFYWFSPVQLPELERGHPWVGLEFNFSVSATAGVMAIYAGFIPI